ncbi:hypothetical protein [Natronorubrum sp. FCH18a]|uniref:hypothetical protein n=1 Tax=Natronorubrum sp. FCH18a TaxID=3447018 RepID=UPI003F517021
MPQSETTLYELCRELDDASPADRPAIASRLHRYVLEDPNAWAEISDPVVELLVPLIDAPDPTVRSRAVFVLNHVGASGSEWCEFSERTVTQSEIVERILDVFDDESKTVRQTVATPFYLEDIVQGVLDGDIEVSSVRLASRLFDALHDSAPIVRKRVGKIVSTHGADLLEAHPESEVAVASLVETLSDPVDGFGVYQQPAVSPRRAALHTLRKGVEHYDTAVLIDHMTPVTSRLQDDRKAVRRAATSLLAELYDRDVIVLDQFADDVLAAIEEGLYPKWWDQYDRLALAVALTSPGAVQPVCEHFRSGITAENAWKDRWSADESLLVALSRLVRVSDASFDPAIETLAKIIARDTTASADTDPLVLLASAHPKFVASQLRDGYRKLVAGDLDHNARFYNDRFYRELVVEVADENPDAIDGVPKILAEDITNRYARRTFLALVEAHPDRSAAHVQAAFENDDWEPPLRFRYSELIETSAAHWHDIPDGLVEVLVETVGAESKSTLDYTKRRRYAVRALVVLHEQGFSVLPDGFEPFVTLYHEGVFDDDEGTDPIDTAAAESAGLV